jgi:uncharacterized membrane protein YeiB
LKGNKILKEGIIKAFLIYLIGFGLAWFVYSIYGHPYIHAPGFHHLIIFFTLIIGLFITIGAILFFFLKKKSSRLKVFIITNLIILFSFVFYFYNLIVYKEKDNTFKEESKNEIITESNGDTTYVYQNKNIVYLKVKDSVLIDLIKDIELIE